jgi:hypothetical protein
MLRPLLRQLASATLGGLPARDAVVAAVALAENDAQFAALAFAFGWLGEIVDAPPGVSIGVATLLSLLLTASLGGDLLLEAGRDLLPLGLGLALAYAAAAEPRDPSRDDPTGDEILIYDVPAALWERQLDKRVRERAAANAARIDSLVASTRGLSAAKGEALKQCCGSRDLAALSAAEWAECDGIGEVLARRVHRALQTDPTI